MGIDAGKNLDQGRLSRAVFPDQRMNLSRIQIETNAIQGLNTREHLSDAFHLKKRGSHVRCSAPGCVRLARTFNVRFRRLEYQLQLDLSAAKKFPTEVGTLCAVMATR